MPKFRKLYGASFFKVTVVLSQNWYCTSLSDNKQRKTSKKAGKLANTYQHGRISEMANKQPSAPAMIAPGQPKSVF